MWFSQKVNGVEFDVIARDDDNLIQFIVNDFTHKKQITQNLTIVELIELKAKIEVLITNYNGADYDE